MKQDFEMAGWCSTVAYPYPQAVIRARPQDSFVLAGCGGGGGAAQLLPSDLLDEMLARAEARLHPMVGPASLGALFDAINSQVCALIRGSHYTGSSAYATAALFTEEQVHLASVGLCRAYRVTPDEFCVLTRDETLFATAVSLGQPAPEWYREIVTRTLNLNGYRVFQAVDGQNA